MMLHSNAYVTGSCRINREQKRRAAFVQLAENTRINLLENSMFQINPYETLTLPILRVFYPKLVAKEAVTVSPMDKPETMLGVYQSKIYTIKQLQPQYDAPVTTPDISQGAAVGTPVSASMASSKLRL
jgi:hypothetical protein